MATVHNEIDTWLAADIHGELSEGERGAFYAHLVECAVCRKAHQENKIMNKILEETLVTEKPDPVFEQRMLAGFRSRIPQRSGLAKVLSDLMHVRAAQITAVAVVLLGLVQIGRMITGESVAPLPSRERYAGRGLTAPQPPALQTEQAAGLGKSDELAAARSRDGGVAEAPSSPLFSAEVKDKRETL